MRKYVLYGALFALVPLGTLAASVATAGNPHEGTGHDPVTICHKPGTPAQQELTVDDDAKVLGHLEHGDTEGPCPTETTTTTEQEPEPEFCRTDFTGGGGVAGWISRNGRTSGAECFSVEVASSCGSVTGLVNSSLQPGYGSPYVLLWNEGAIDLNTAQGFPAVFPEDYNGGSVEITYYIAGPEKDWLVGSGHPNFWDGNGVAITVDTDCIEPPLTTTETTTTPAPPRCPPGMGPFRGKDGAPGNDECCPDQNNNQICDDEESGPPPTSLTQTTPSAPSPPAVAATPPPVEPPAAATEAEPNPDNPPAPQAKKKPKAKKSSTKKVAKKKVTLTGDPEQDDCKDIGNGAMRCKGGVVAIQGNG